MAVTAFCEIFFGSDAGRGWAEGHHIVVTTPLNLGPVFSAFKTLVDTFRKPLLANDRYIKGLKVSAPTPLGDIASAPYRYAPVGRPSNKRSGCGPSLAAKMHMADSTNTRFSPIYLRGFWDDVEVDEELDFTSAAGAAWKALLDQYTTALVAGGYGWNGLDNTNTIRGNVTNYTIDVNGFVTFTVDYPAGPVAFNPGEINTVRFARINHSSSTLNRSLVLKVLTATTLKTVNPIAAGLFDSAGTFVAEGKAFLSYLGAQYTILARRSEGRPTGLSPARRKARART